MPPRKSNASNASGGGDAPTAPAPLTGAQVQQAAAERSGYSIEDLAFPRTMVSRLAKSAVPPNTQMARDAQWAVWKSATVFVNYLASNAAEHAGRASKKTIQPPDILDAVRDLELPNFTARLEAELAKWNENQTEKRAAAKARAKDRAAASAAAKTDEGKTEDGTTADGEADNGRDAEDEAAAQLAAEAGAARSAGGSPAAAAVGGGARAVVGGGAKKAGDGEPAKKKVRRSTVGEGEAVDHDDEEEVEEEDDGEDEEDEDDDEDEDEGDQDGGRADLHAEDDIEEKAPVNDEDEAMDSDGSD